MKKPFIAAAVLFCTAAVVFGGTVRKRVAPAAAPAPAASRPVAKPVAKPAAKPVAKPVAKPAAAKPAAKPAVAKSAAKPTAKPAAKPAPRPAAKPVPKPAAPKPPPPKPFVSAPEPLPPPPPPANGPGYRPAGTVAFANLDLIANTVASIPAKGSHDPVLSSSVPALIRNQCAAKLFGAMRPDAHGVAVCYVDPAIAARVAAAKRPSDADLDRVKRWCVVYPTGMTREMFLQRHPTCVPEADGTLKVPPGNHSRRTFWAWFAPRGQWAVLAPSPSMARNAYAAAAREVARPLNGDLAHIRMDAAGTRAVFGAELCAGGFMAIRMTARGLELRGSARGIAMRRPPLKPQAHALSGVPASSPLFGVTTTPFDVKMAEDIFSKAGPEFALFVRSSLQHLQGQSYSAYYLDVLEAPATQAPAARLAAILPEARMMPATANTMFCSPTTVLRHCLPKVAAKMMPLDSAKLHFALRLLRRARGDGLACMNWREGDEDKILIRISRDELWGTANIWSLMF